ncbi:MAG: hypothetical protein ABI880_03335 [Acidobacteriota bacterium]
MRQPVVTTLLMLLCLLGLASDPATAQVAMPDASQLSGVPLPGPELANGVVTVRVVRERMGNNVPGQSVALITSEGRVTAITDAQGRAEFTSVPPGSSVTAEVTVDGETIQSQAFPVPTTGGTRVALVLGVAKAAAATAATKAAAAKEPARAGVVVFGPDTRIVLEFQDDKPTFFYLFSIMNNARTPVDPGRPLVLELPAAAEGASMVAGNAQIARMEGRTLTLVGPFPPGASEYQLAFRLPFTSRITLTQAFPAAVEGLLVAAEKVGGLTLTSAQLTAIREGASSGQVLVMGTAGRVAEGQAVTLEFSGLPAAPVWPGRVAIGIALALFLWGGWAAWQGAPDTRATRDTLLAERERLLGAIAAIDAQGRARGVVDPRAVAKRERLLVAVEQIYAELDELPGGSGTAA